MTGISTELLKELATRFPTSGAKLLNLVGGRTAMGWRGREPVQSGPQRAIVPWGRPPAPLGVQRQRP